MKPYIKKVGEYFTVYDPREYQSRAVNVLILKTKHKSEAELMIKYLTEI